MANVSLDITRHFMEVGAEVAFRAYISRLALLHDTIISAGAEKSKNSRKKERLASGSRPGTRFGFGEMHEIGGSFSCG